MKTLLTPFLVLFSLAMACFECGWNVSRLRGDDAISAASPIQLNFGAHLSPATAASLQIEAEAEYLRAYGQMQLDFAQTRILNSKAAALEGENAVQAIINEIRKRELLEAARAKRVGPTLMKHRANYEKKLEQLKYHPELSASEINSGAALNFLKNRLSSSLVTYHTTSKDIYATKDVARQLRLTPEMRHSLQVRQAVAYGDSLVFRLDDGKAMQVDWWPPALRNRDVQQARTKFERIRGELFHAQSQQQFDDKIKELLVAHEALNTAFVNQAALSWEKRRINTNAMNDYRDGKNMLRSLLAEIHRMERLGFGKATQNALAFSGTEGAELVAHMVRNGLDFAPAKPGDEPAYQQLFHMLRDLYAAAETDAEIPEPAAKPMIPEFPTRLPTKEQE